MTGEALGSCRIGDGICTAQGEPPGFLYECCSPEATLHPHWRMLFAGLERLGTSGLAARTDNARRMLREQGVTCFVHAQGVARDEPWQLDLLPVVITAEEWRRLECGLRQRAQLLNLVLQDLYGVQRLVRDGFIPAPLLFANPGYLRPCQGLQVKAGRFLLSYSADLARGADGRWWVVADRAQSPTGFGFAMQNRSVLSRVMPELLRDLRPRPINDFLRIRRDALRRLAPGENENASIALLTPGPRNESYFEHAYLARLLGLTLVEGDDLTVRDRGLWVKTLNGLRPVDVVLRRVSDAFCDPLELRGDSLLGVPGLLEAVRAGRVTVANAIGAGLIDAPAFMPFLPGLSRHLLDQELLLPSLATWWCGQACEQFYVHEHLHDLVINPAFSLSAGSVPFSELEERPQAALTKRMGDYPYEFVGQEQVRLSRTPMLAGGEVVPKPFILRVFVFFNGTEYSVMPGGLARVLEVDRTGSTLVPLCGISKDVWVLPDSTAESQHLHLVSAPHPQSEGAHSDIPSRTADNLFWLGRYTERLEEIARSTRYALTSIGDDADPVSQSRLFPLHGLLHQLGLAASPGPTFSREALQQQLLDLVYDGAQVPGVRDLLERIHLAAFSVRDRLSSDTWHLLNRMRNYGLARTDALPFIEASGLLHNLVLDLAAFSGMEMENMTRGHGWIFLDFGRRLERGIFMAQLMEAVSRSGPGLELLVEPALEIADSVMTHRRRYFSEPRLSSVMEVLVHDVTNPRSLAFQLSLLQKHAAVLPVGDNPDGVAALKALIRELPASLVGVAGAPPTAPAGAEACALERGATHLAQISERLTEVYFSHVSPRLS